MPHLYDPSKEAIDYPKVIKKEQYETVKLLNEEARMLSKNTKGIDNELNNIYSIIDNE